MGARFGREANGDDSFLMRICVALDEPPRMLAKNIGVPYSELAPLLKGSKGQLVEIDRDETWWMIDQYVSKKLGHLMAVKFEMNKALQEQRKARVARHALMRSLPALDE